MFPANFKDSNAALSAEPGVTANAVEPLCVHRGSLPDGRPVVVSCWKVTKEELEEINRTHRVWVMALGKTQPPLCLEGTSPFSDEGELQ